MATLDIPRAELVKEAHSLIQFVSTCTRSDGLLCGWVDAKTGTRDKNHLLPDFGDWAPFFLYFGHPATVDAHLRALPQHLDRNGILRASQRKLGVSVTTAFEHTDLLLGLLDCADAGSAEARRAAESLCDACIHRFKIGQAGIRSYYVPSLRVALPTTSAVDATFIELLVLAARTLDASRFMETAQDLAGYFLDLPFVRRYHLFPELSGFAWGPRARRAQTMKHNTNTVFGLLELQRARPQRRLRRALDTWIEHVPELLDEKGYAYFSITRRGSRWIGSGADIVPSVGLLDALCDCAFFLDSGPALEHARTLGEKLIALQNPDTGLIRRNPETLETHLDAQTDLIVAWEKLSEVSGDERFSRAAATLFRGMRQYHQYKGGYVQSCDSRDGMIVNYRYTTRYNSLFLKAYLVYLSDTRLYADEKLLGLLKDR